MSGYTKGPWRLNARPETAWCGEDKVSIEAGPMFIATVDHCRAQMDNARLIAAAPDLLEALESCIEHGSMTGAEWVVDKARAAIAKARGEA